jgi:hypothetical protein
MGNNEGARRPFQSQSQVNAHDVNDLVCIDDIIDYTIMHHEVNNVKVNDDNKDSGNNSDNALLAIMAGQGSSSGDIRQVLATKSTPDKSKNRQANESKLAPSTVQVGDATYYLNKGETMTFQGHQYSSHMTKVNYRIGQYDITTMDYALIDHSANGGICGDHILVLEGSERFVDVCGLAGHTVSQLRIVTAQALISTYKGEAIATFYQMALLGKGKSIFSCLHMEAFGADIHDRSRMLPGGNNAS